MEFSSVCRICMESISLEYIDLDTPFNDQTFFDCFNFCTRLNAFASDKLPKTVCISCGYLLETTYNFISTALKTDELLRDTLANIDSDVKNEFVDTIGDLPTQIILPPIFEDEQSNNENEIIINFQKDKAIDPNEENLINAEQLSNAEIGHIVQVISDGKLENVLVFTSEAENKLLPEHTIKALDQNSITECFSKPADQQISQTSEDDLNQSLLQTSGTENVKPNECYNLVDAEENRIEDNIDESNILHQCKQCDSSFVHLKDLERHTLQMHTQNFKDYWYCNLCGEAVNSRTKLISHRNNDHRGRELGLCITCGQSFADLNSLTEHVTKEHWSRKSPENCPYCKKKFQLDSLSKHVRYKHTDVVSFAEDQEFVCDYCLKVCTDLDKLQIHIEKHTAAHNYECDVCGIDLITKENFENHKKQLHQSPGEEQPPPAATSLKLRKCPKCDFTTLDEKFFTKHKKRHYNKNRNNNRNANQLSSKKPRNSYLCAYCPQKFDYIKVLQDHEDFRHGEQKNAHVCDVCGKKYLSSALLRKHKDSTHGNDRPFMCTLCPKAFKLKSQLNQHLKFHTKPNIECPHCDKKFLMPCYLRVHLRTHTNELPYECHLCDRKFPIKVRLTYHLAKHEGILRQCEFCPETFKNVAKLRIHRFEHIGYPFVCDFCEEKHHRRIGFARHMRRAHGIVVTDAEINENRNKNMKKVYRNTKCELKSVDQNQFASQNEEEI